MRDALGTPVMIANARLAATDAMLVIAAMDDADG
jgi:hypothetical protein